MPCQAQIRAQHAGVAASVEPLDNQRVRVMFEIPQTAVTPGQVVTLYQEDLVLGGGWIDKAVSVSLSDFRRIFRLHPWVDRRLM